MNNKYGLDLEIGGLWYTPFWQSNLFYAIFGFILVLLVGVIGYKLRKRSNVAAQDPIVMLIESLRSKELQISKVNAQLFYFDLTLKFKEFFGYKYKFELQYKTDSEIKKFLQKEKTSQVDEQLIKTFLEILDRSYVIRFAKNNISKEQMSVDLQKTIDLMQQVSHQPCEKL